jgi:uncharacterized lipoprotein YajG
MKKLFIMVAVLSLTACGTSKIPGYDGPKALDRGDVVKGARDCINGRLKPTVQYLSQKTEHGVVMVPVAVNCDPYTHFNQKGE